MVRYRKVVVGRFCVTLSRDGHGGGIASREAWLLYKDPCDAIAGSS